MTLDQTTNLNQIKSKKNMQFAIVYCTPILQMRLKLKLIKQ